MEHCRDAWGLAFGARAGWSLVYSGDSRPCSRLQRAGAGCTLLVHEATFEPALLAQVLPVLAAHMGSLSAIACMLVHSLQVAPTCCMHRVLACASSQVAPWQSQSTLCMHLSGADRCMVWLGWQARQKRHSTTEEALSMGARMGAYRVILTHFSNRYPKAGTGTLLPMPCPDKPDC